MDPDFTLIQNRKNASVAIKSTALLNFIVQRMNLAHHVMTQHLNVQMGNTKHTLALISIECNVFLAPQGVS